MRDEDLARLSLSEAAQLIETRALTASELTAACIARTRRLEPQLNAFFTTSFAAATRLAEVADEEIGREEYRGPLHGIPFGLKDLFETAGLCTSAGSTLRWDYIPEEDAEVVTRLKQAGVALMGKLNMHEWALGTTNINAVFPSPLNPWDAGRITGGSSGGCGAAIAAGLCLGAMGSDTRGSIRIPASLCGVTGLKPTYGRVSMRGVVPLNWSLDHVGPMARSAADCALILQTVAGFDPRDPTSVSAPVPDYAAALRTDLKEVRIGVPRNFFFEVDPLVSETVLATTEVFASLGAEVSAIEFPDPPRYHDDGAFQAEAAGYHEERLRETPERFSDGVRERLLDGAAVTGIEYARARYRQAELKLALRHLFREVDLVLTPTTQSAAPRFPRGETIPAAFLARNTWQFNFAGVPAISLPCGFTREGMPIGLQLAGRWWEEGLVLGAAHAYQSVTDWHKRAPPL